MTLTRFPMKVDNLDGLAAIQYSKIMESLHKLTSVMETVRTSRILVMSFESSVAAHSSRRAIDFCLGGETRDLEHKSETFVLPSKSEDRT
jgi:hypothetical protein